MSGSSNFIQHNPTEANQENDAAFAADSTTTGGIGVDQIMPSPWMNKRWYQDSTMVAALGAMLAAKGYVVSDANLATLISVLTGAFITNNDLKTPLVSVGYSPTPTFPASTANGFDIVLGGNVTSSAFNVAPSIGQILTFVITQTGGGGATFVPPASVNGWQPIDPTASSVSIQQFIVKVDGSIWPLTRVIATEASTLAIMPGRAYGVPYGPATTPTFVSVAVTSSGGPGANTDITLVSGATTGSMVVRSGNGAHNGGGQMGVSYIVPAGHYWQVNAATSFGGTADLEAWSEVAVGII